MSQTGEQGAPGWSNCVSCNEHICSTELTNGYCKKCIIKMELYCDNGAPSWLKSRRHK